MSKSIPQTIIGVMSGSSLDGLDVAMCSFSESEGNTQWEILAVKTFSFDDQLLKQLISVDKLDVESYLDLDVALAKFTAECIKQMPLWQNADAVSIHGHTIMHEPKKGYSSQITNPWILAAELKLPVVADFRNADIALGGQGAPLVPIADLDLFPEYTSYLNLGGIANVTVKTESGIEAFDVFACNQWLNALSQMLGKEYDADGNLSAKGEIIDEIVKCGLSWSFVQQKAPKSLSNQMCKVFFTENILPFCHKYSIEDVMRSCIRAMAIAIENAVGKSQGSMLVTGGGVYNNTLLGDLKSNLVVHIPTPEIIEFKEAVAFAYLGYCHQIGKTSNVPEATGACRKAVLGCLYKF